MEHDKNARGMSALRLELLQSGLTLGMNSSPQDGRKDGNSRPSDIIFSLGNPSLKTRLAADGRVGLFGVENGDGAVVDKASRRESSSMSELADVRLSKSAQYDLRPDTVQPINQMVRLSESTAVLYGLSTQDQPLLRQGILPQMPSLPNSHNNDGLLKPSSEEPRPKPHESTVVSPKTALIEHGSQAGLHQTLKSGQRRRTANAREGKDMMSTGSRQQSSQRYSLQQVVDVRDSKGIKSTGTSEQQSFQKQVLQQQDIHCQKQDFQEQPPQVQEALQQVLDSRRTKGVMDTGSRPQFMQQKPALHQQALCQHGVDARENKGVISSKCSKQTSLPQHSSLHQQKIHHQVFDGRESQGTMIVGNLQKQGLHRQSASHPHALQQQALDTIEIKSTVITAGPHQQALQQQTIQQALQKVIDVRDSKATKTAGGPQHQALQQHTLQQQGLHQQGLEARESKLMIPAGSPQKLAVHHVLQQNPLHQQIWDSRESKGLTHAVISQQQALHQQALQHEVVDVRDQKGVIPGGSFHRQGLQQQTLQQHACRQESLLQLGYHITPAQTLHPPDVYKGYHHLLPHSTEHHSSSQYLTTVNLRVAYAMNQPKTEPIELEGTTTVERSSSDKVSHGGRPSTSDSTSPKNSVSVAETDGLVELGLNGLKVEDAKPSVSLSSAAESKDSVRSGSHPEPGESLHPQSHSSGRTSRENMFADLNVEPPASDGEDEGTPPSNVVQMAQPESSRTTNEQKRQRKKLVKDPRTVLEADEADAKKPIKPAKLQARSKELTLESGLEGDGDNHLTGFPTTKDDKIKSLKLGLINVAHKLPKNAHAHFSLGLMHQRCGQSVKAAQSFRQAAEILKQAEEETGQSRCQFLAVVQVHQAQCVLEGSLGGQLPKLGPVKELLNEELENLVNKLKEATLLEPGQVSVWSSFGFLLLRSGRIQSAIYVLVSLLDIVPNHVETLANLGVAYLHSGAWAHATRCFQCVLEKDIRHPGALVNYAALLLRQYCSSFAGAGAGAGRGAYVTRLAAAHTAQQCLQAALKEDPKAGYIWANLAAAYATLGNIARASQCLEQAAKLEPARMSTVYAVAAHRVKDGERCEDANEQLGWAANEMASILREGNFANIQPRLAWGGLAMVNRAQHETAAAFEGGGIDLKEVEERALHTLQQAIEEDPEDAVQWHQMGLHTLCTLQFGAAQNYLKTAISRRPTNPSAWSNLGIALQLSEDPSRAEGVYKQALALAPQEQAHSILSNLGNLYRQQRKFNEAHEMFKSALGLCPDYAPACNNLGLLLVAEGKWDDAIASFDQALNADPYLDAAKSNQMKAVALSQIRHVERLLGTQNDSLPSESAVVQGASNAGSPVESSTIGVSNLLAFSPDPCQREPFPLPSVS